MHLQDPVFDRIESAIRALDATTDARIKGVDERLRALGVAVEVYLDDPVDVFGDRRLHLGYARMTDGFTLAVKRIASNAEASVEALQGADRVTRLAAVDRLPALLEAIEAELSRRKARIGTRNAATAATGPAPPPAPSDLVGAPAPPTPETTSKVDMPLRPVPVHDVPVQAGPAAGESVDHMFRLFGRKGR
jgi:hypothetical protein